MTVEQFAYLRSPDKIRAALINAGGPRLSVDTIERRLRDLAKRTAREGVGEPTESDGKDFHVAGLVKAPAPATRPKRVRSRQSPTLIERAAKAAGGTPSSELRYVRAKPTAAGTPFSDALIEEVCEAFEVPTDLLLGPSRWWKLAAIRSMIVVLLRERSEAIYSYPRIARILGRTCHTTIVYSHQRFEHYCTLFPDVAALYLEMREGGK